MFGGLLRQFCIIVVPQALSAYSLCGVRVISSCFPNVMEIIGTSPGNKMVHRMEPDEGKEVKASHQGAGSP